MAFLKIPICYAKRYPASRPHVHRTYIRVPIWEETFYSQKQKSPLLFPVILNASYFLPQDQVWLWVDKNQALAAFPFSSVYDSQNKCKMQSTNTSQMLRWTCLNNPTYDSYNKPVKIFWGKKEQEIKSVKIKISIETRWYRPVNHNWVVKARGPWVPGQPGLQKWVPGQPRR